MPARIMLYFKSSNVRLGVRDPHAVFFVGDARSAAQRRGHIQELMDLRHDEPHLKHHRRLGSVGLFFVVGFVLLVLRF